MTIYMEQTLAMMQKSQPERIKQILDQGKVKKLDSVNYVKLE